MKPGAWNVPMHLFRFIGRRKNVGIAHRDERRDVDRCQPRPEIRPFENGVLLTQKGVATHPLRHRAHFFTNGTADVTLVHELRQHASGDAEKTSMPK